MRVLIAAGALLVGCSTTTPEKAPPLGPAEVRSAKAAADGITIGRSTKADVRAALGQAVVLDFATGYEVWVYKERPRDKAASELVLLFDPAGVVTKTRVR